MAAFILWLQIWMGSKAQVGEGTETMSIMHSTEVSSLSLIDGMDLYEYNPSLRDLIWILAPPPAVSSPSFAVFLLETPRSRESPAPKINNQP